MSQRPTQPSRILITGASGFIGLNLARHLVSAGHTVSCLVRRSSNASALKSRGCRLVFGDLTQTPASQLAREIGPQDAVYHLAGRSRAAKVSDLMDTNVEGTRRLLDACLELKSAPVVLLVSSLAAMGCNRAENNERPFEEADPCRPISNYGHSKHASERLVRQYSDRLAISIVRPPIVLGPHNRAGFILFRTIQQTGCHFVPGWLRERKFSVIHVDDLIDAMIRIVAGGERVAAVENGQGVYFASGDQSPSFRNLGLMVGRAMERQFTMVVRVPDVLIWTIASVNQALGRLTGKRFFLDRDKAREGMSGSWMCSHDKITQQLGYYPAADLPQRLTQTADWYREEGWLKSPRPISDETLNDSQDESFPSPSGA